MSGVGCRVLSPPRLRKPASMQQNRSTVGASAELAQAPVARSYQDLLVWRLGMDLAVACYELARLLPKEEVFGLASQIRRASSSVPANIAEGYGRGHRGEYTHFLHIAQGSLKETETHIHLCLRVGLLRDAQVADAFSLADRLGRALHNLIKSLQ